MSNRAATRTVAAVHVEDRKVAWGALLILAVLALEFAWFLFVGPAERVSGNSLGNTGEEGVPWWGSAAFWTACFTLLLTVSTTLLWWQTRRLAEGADAQVEKLERYIEQTKIAAEAAQKSAAVSEQALTELEGAHIDIARLEYLDGEIQVRLKNYGRSAAKLRELKVCAVVETWNMEGRSKVAEYIETLEARKMIAAGEDDLFNTRFLCDKFSIWQAAINGGDFALRVNILFSTDGLMKDDRVKAAQWHVWDFRFKNFISSFELPNFQPH